MKQQKVKVRKTRYNREAECTASDHQKKQYRVCCFHVTGNAAGKSGRNLWNTDRNFTESISENVKITVDGICGAETWKKVVEHMNANR